MTPDEAKAIVDARIKELFESGTLKITLVEHRAAYCDSTDYTIKVTLDDEKLYETTTVVKFSGI